MKKKTILLLLLTGFFVGVMAQESISQLRWRSVAIGGEICLIPMIALLVWFGWVMRDGLIKVNVRRWKNGNSRRK